MKILKTIKKDFSYGSFKTIRWGNYSPNKTLLFFLICILCIAIIFGKSLNNIAIQIKNKYLKDIYLACTAPFVNFSEKYKIDIIIPETRVKFLNISKLEQHTEWDNFYYNSAPIKNKIQKSKSTNILKKNKNDLKQLNSNMKEIQSDLTLLKKNMADLKKLKNTNIITEKPLYNDNGKINLPIITKDLKPKQKLIEKKTTTTFEFSKENPLKILMIGDSQMRSIAGGLLRLTGKNAPIEIKEISVHSSGFIRGDYYNWEKKLTNVFRTEKNKQFDIAIIFLGMNDYQNFYNDNGKILVKETKLWEEEYEKKIKKHLDILLENTKKVYWLGMPIVRDRVYNENLIYIEKIQNKIARNYSKATVTKFSIQAIAPGEGVPYTEIIKTKKLKTIKLMRDDGVHFTISGGEYIMKPLLDLLYQEWDIAPINRN